MASFYRTINSFRLINSERTCYTQELTEKMNRIEKLKDFCVKLNSILEEFLLSETHENVDEEMGIINILNVLTGKPVNAANYRRKLADYLSTAENNLGKESEFGRLLSLWGKSLCDLQLQNDIFLSQLFTELLKPIQNYHNNSILNFYDEFEELEDLRFEFDVLKFNYNIDKVKYENKYQEVSIGFETQVIKVDKLADDVLHEEKSLLTNCLADSIFAQRDYHSNCFKTIEDFIQDHSLIHRQKLAPSEKHISETLEELKSWRDDKISTDRKSTIHSGRIITSKMIEEEKKRILQESKRKRESSRHELNSESCENESSPNGSDINISEIPETIREEASGKLKNSSPRGGSRGSSLKSSSKSSMRKSGNDQGSYMPHQYVIRSSKGSVKKTDDDQGSYIPHQHVIRGSKGSVKKTDDDQGSYIPHQHVIRGSKGSMRKTDDDQDSYIAHQHGIRGSKGSMRKTDDDQDSYMPHQHGIRGSKGSMRKTDDDQDSYMPHQHVTRGSKGSARIVIDTESNTENGSIVCPVIVNIEPVSDIHSVDDAYLSRIFSEIKLSSDWENQIVNVDDMETINKEMNSTNIEQKTKDTPAAASSFFNFDPVHSSQDNDEDENENFCFVEKFRNESTRKSIHEYTTKELGLSGEDESTETTKDW